MLTNDPNFFFNSSLICFLMALTSISFALLLSCFLTNNTVRFHTKSSRIQHQSYFEPSFIAFENNLLVVRCFATAIEIVFSCFVILNEAFCSRLQMPLIWSQTKQRNLATIPIPPRATARPLADKTAAITPVTVDVV